MPRVEHTNDLLSQANDAYSSLVKNLIVMKEEEKKPPPSEYIHSIERLLKDESLQRKTLLLYLPEKRRMNRWNGMLLRCGERDSCMNVMDEGILGSSHSTVSLLLTHTVLFDTFLLHRIWRLSFSPMRNTSVRMDRWQRILSLVRVKVTQLFYQGSIQVVKIYSSTSSSPQMFTICTILVLSDMRAG